MSGQLQLILLLLLPSVCNALTAAETSDDISSTHSRLMRSAEPGSAVRSVVSNGRFEQPGTSGDEYDATLCSKRYKLVKGKNPHTNTFISGWTHRSEDTCKDCYAAHVKGQDCHIRRNDGRQVFEGTWSAGLHVSTELRGESNKVIMEQQITLTKGHKYILSFAAKRQGMDIICRTSRNDNVAKVKCQKLELLVEVGKREIARVLPPADTSFPLYIYEFTSDVSDAALRFTIRADIVYNDKPTKSSAPPAKVVAYDKQLEFGTVLIDAVVVAP